MMKQSTSLFILVSWLTIVWCSISNVICKRDNDPHPNLIFLGSVDGKGIYAERTYITWREADEYCRNVSMKLLSITSPAQMTFLLEYNDTSSGLGPHSFWTSARDSHMRRQLSWNDDEDELGEYIPWNSGPAPPPVHLSCGLLLLSIPGGHMKDDNCEWTNGVLCEENAV